MTTHPKPLRLVRASPAVPGGEVETRVRTPARPIANAPEIVKCLRGAVRRLEREARRAAPHLGARLARWMTQLAARPDPVAYFIGPRSFPMFALPWWLEHSLTGSVDHEFQSPLMYSTVAGYYYVRLIDDVMDDGAEADRSLLPAASFLMMEFQGGYHAWFPAEHPFWRVYRREWSGAAEVASRDANAPVLTSRQFTAVAGRKTRAIGIPLAAVCFRVGRVDALPAWLRFIDAYGRFAQMLDDVFDWYTDQTRGPNATWFVTQGTRRKRSRETLFEWVMREGFGWGVEQCRRRVRGLEVLAEDLGSDAVRRHLQERRRMLERDHAEISAGLRQLATLQAAVP